MTTAGDEDLAALIVREQAGFRRILQAGVVTLIIMALISAALGVYLYIASQSLMETTRVLQANAFETRRRVDAQNNRIVAQEIAIRRTYDEIRQSLGEAQVAATPETVALARNASAAFLLRGRIPTLTEQRAIRQFGARRTGAVSLGAHGLFAGVTALLNYETRGEQIAADAEELPPTLATALQGFETATDAADTRGLGRAGLAWIAFEDASSARNNYSTPACTAVFEAIDAIGDSADPSPQPLYWRAQCERKVGLTSQALEHYAQALRASTALTENGGARDAAELTLAMNAYHGVGTTLIAGFDIPDDAPGMRDALAIAEEACPNLEAYSYRSNRMAMALSCLDEAIALRRALGQTDNQLSGSGENISFAHLRDGDFNAAYQNAAAIERTGIFAWNEVVRALVAPRTRFAGTRARRAAAADARRNVSMFSVGQFNICELRALFDEDHYEAARRIIAETHPGEEVRCEQAD